MQTILESCACVVIRVWMIQEASTEFISAAGGCRVWSATIVIEMQQPPGHSLNVCVCGGGVWVQEACEGVVAIVDG